MLKSNDLLPGFCITILVSFYSQVSICLVCQCKNNINCPSYNPVSTTCEVGRPESYCFSTLQYTYDEYFKIFRENRTQGCIDSEVTKNIVCVKSLADPLRPSKTLCCNAFDNCNWNLVPHLDEIFSEEEQNEFPLPKAQVESAAERAQEQARPAAGNGFVYNLIYVACGTGVISFGASYVFCALWYRKAKKKATVFSAEKGQVNEHSISSDSLGSGGGVARLVERTLGKDIKFLDVIGKGSYGEVVKGLRRGVPVAVKIFFTVEELSWQNEKNIYNNSRMNHENILRFINADIVANNSCTRLLLVTEYHENGSLYDYLQHRTIDEQLLLKMSLSIIMGLEHLHEEYQATYAKVAIAHRDLKSKNIMVKRNLECCIADFGLAVASDSIGEDFEFKQVGTKRYMAPEILNSTLDTRNFGAFRRADVYSFCLILWELCYSYAEGTYNLPYYDVVPSDPTLETMKDVAVDKKIRPEIHFSNWRKNMILQEIKKILEESWHENPMVRRSALKIRKDIQKLCQ